ncbi:MAG: pyridoxamine 5'-phosphate oxidase family protein [Myxococcota bacterium]
MEWNTVDADVLYDQLWAKLVRAKADRRSPWRTPVVATVSDEGPEARIVVLRRVEIGEALSFHTDARSAKYPQLERNPRITWVFWDPRGNVQLRATTVATVHRGDAIAQRAWDTQSPPAQELFAQPGRPGAPFGDSTQIPDPFVWVRCTVEKLDWLWLTEPQHVRFRWIGAEGARVVP